MLGSPSVLLGGFNRTILASGVNQVKVDHKVSEAGVFF